MKILKTLALLAGTALAVATTAGPASAQKAGWPDSMVLGTASVGGTYFIYGQGWANLVNETIGTRISTQQTQGPNRSEEHTSELQSLMRRSYAVFRLNKKKKHIHTLN